MKTNAFPPALLVQTLQAAQTYLTSLTERRPFPDAAAQQALQGFDEDLPQSETPDETIVAQLAEIGSRAAVAIGGGRYFGFVMGGCLPAALAAHWLAGTWDQNAFNEVTSPLAHRLETVTSRWLLDVLDLPRTATVGYVAGAAMANLTALTVARSALMARCGWNFRRQGMQGAPALRVLLGAEAHPVVTRALSLLGFGTEEWQTLPVDDQGRIDPTRLPALDDRTLLGLQAGNVNSGAFDPFAEICAKAQAAGAWVHVDGAFGLWARASRKKRALTHGIAMADSWACDAHKWLNVPYDSAFYACRDGAAVADAFDIEAPYLLRQPDRRAAIATMDMSRRARAIEIWAALKSLGRDGVEDLVDRCCRLARRFADRLAAAGFDILNDVVLNQVVVGWGDGTNIDALVRQVQAEGTCWLGPTHWQGRKAFRLSISSWASTDDDIDRSADALIATAQTLSTKEP